MYIQDLIDRITATPPAAIEGKSTDSVTTLVATLISYLVCVPHLSVYHVTYTGLDKTLVCVILC